MYGLVAAREVLQQLVATDQLSPEEHQMCADRIANLVDCHTEFEIGTLLHAVFHGINEDAQRLVENFDHRHLAHANSLP